MKMRLKITISFFAAGFVLAGIGWLVIVLGQPALVMFVAIPLAALIVGLFTGGVVFRNLAGVAKGASIVRSGSLEYKIGTKANDEVGQISRDIDGIAEDLKKARFSIDVLNMERTRFDKTEKELSAREEHFRNLFEHSNDAVFIHDLDGKLIDVNNKACEMLGYDKETLLGIPFMDLQTEEELTSSKEARRIGDEKCAVRFESKLRKVDGVPINVEISSSVVDLKKGIMQAIVRDITERKKLEEALKESEEKFRTFMETASDLMYITSKYGELKYVNQTMASALGYTVQEMQGGMHITDIMEDKTKEAFKGQHRQLVTNGEVMYEPVWETKNRRKIYGEVKESSIYDMQGRFAGSRGVFRDITERKKIEEAQRLAQLGKLAADVAHEVNNPVTVISARAQLYLRDEKVDEKIKKNLEIIVQQCEQAQSIVHRLLKFSKPSRGEIKEIDINDTIKSVINLVEPHFRGSAVRLATELMPSPSRVKADEKHMQEVFMNLLRNAAEAMPDGGTVTVKTSLDGDNVRIDFIDTGSGIAEEDLKRIFDPFFTTKENGTGLGLSVCYGILKSHGGDLKYKSRPGEGTTATVLLPAG